MVDLQEVRRSNTTLIHNQPTPLVAVFFGGTSGIGHYTIRALATAAAASNGDGTAFRAYVVGRKLKAAEEVISECRGIYPQGQYKFIKVDDLSLMGDVDRACSEIIQQEEKEAGPRIDYLMTSQGGSIFLPRIDTKEGIDLTMSLMYYSRMKIITKLLPLLLRSNLPARIISVFAAGSESRFIPEDLSLRDPKHYSYTQARSHMVHMHTLFMEKLAENHCGKLSFVHIFPGLVPGPAHLNPELPWWWQLMAGWFLPLFGRLIMIPASECGERMLSLASPRYPPRPVELSSQELGKEIAVGTDGKAGSGVYSLTWNGENNLNAEAYSSEKMDKDGMRKRVFEHTMRAFEVIEAGQVFTD